MLNIIYSKSVKSSTEFSYNYNICRFYIYILFHNFKFDLNLVQCYAKASLLGHLIK